MLVKSSIAAVAVLAAVVSLSRVDYRELYDEMYPVNGLRRDVLNLCHDAKPTFVRALQTDRVNCYDSMPDPVEIAIGWVRSTTRALATRRPSAVERAEKLLVEATMPGREDLLAPRRFTGYVAQPAAVRPCKGTALAAADAAATALAPPADPALRALGLVPRGGRPGLSATDALAGTGGLPVLSLDPGAVGGGGIPGGLIDGGPIDASAAAALGDSMPLPPEGCRTPA